MKTSKVWNIWYIKPEINYTIWLQLFYAENDRFIWYKFVKLCLKDKYFEQVNYGAGAELAVFNHNTTSTNSSRKIISIMFDVLNSRSNVNYQE